MFLGTHKGFYRKDLQIQKGILCQMIYQTTYYLLYNSSPEWLSAK